MQAYEQGFASAYNHYLAADFAEAIAPQMHVFYADTPIGQVNRSILDVGCGTGQLARYFLDHQYRVTGIDLSANMLRHAEENARQYVEAGLARFILADASAFKLDARFGLVVSTFDALNHLESEASLRSCFKCVYDVLVSGGYFIFDLNTRLGLSRWKEVDLNINDGDTKLLIKGRYDGCDRAYMTFSGIAYADGQRTPFEEIVFETIFDLERVRAALIEIGWREVYFAQRQDLQALLASPEQERKVVVVAHK